MGSDLKPRKSLWAHFREGARKAHSERPASFYLLLAIPVVLLLGARMTRSLDNPVRFAFYLSVVFVFFLVVILRAVVDFFEIAKRHFHEREQLFRTTFGDEEFIAQVKERRGRGEGGGE